MKEKVFTANEVVFREGDPGNCFYQILEGTAGVYLNYGEADERKLTEMKPGQYFGEMAVIDTWPRSTTVIAEQELRTFEISEAALNDYFAEEPDRILALMKQLSNRIRSLTVEYDEVNAFLKEKQDAEAAKKPGFLEKLKKYRELNRLAKKNTQLLSVESVQKMESFLRPDDSPVPISSYRKGDVIFHEGEEGRYMYSVQSGSVGIYTGYGTTLEQKLTTLFPGTFFGEMGMIDNERRSATAVIEENDTTLECISSDDLENLFKSNAVEIDLILRHLSYRLRRLTKDYADACAAAVEDL